METVAIDITKDDNGKDNDYDVIIVNTCIYLLYIHICKFLCTYVYKHHLYAIYKLFIGKYAPHMIVSIVLGKVG